MPEFTGNLSFDRVNELLDSFKGEHFDEYGYPTELHQPKNIEALRKKYVYGESNWDKRQQNEAVIMNARREAIRANNKFYAKELEGMDSAYARQFKVDERRGMLVDRMGGTINEAMERGSRQLALDTIAKTPMKWRGSFLGLKDFEVEFDSIEDQNAVQKFLWGSYGAFKDMRDGIMQTITLGAWDDIEKERQAPNFQKVGMDVARMSGATSAKEFEEIVANAMGEDGYAYMAGGMAAHIAAFIATSGMAAGGMAAAGMGAKTSMVAGQALTAAVLGKGSEDSVLTDKLIYGAAGALGAAGGQAVARWVATPLGKLFATKMAETGMSGGARAVAGVTNMIANFSADYGVQFAVDRAEAAALGNDFHYGMHFGISALMQAAVGGRPMHRIQEKVRGVQAKKSNQKIDEAVLDFESILGLEPQVREKKATQIREAKGLTAVEYSVAVAEAEYNHNLKFEQAKELADNRTQQQTVASLHQNVLNAPKDVVDKIVKNKDVQAEHVSETHTMDASIAHPADFLGRPTQESNVQKDVGFAPSKEMKADMDTVQSSHITETMHLREDLEARSNAHRKHKRTIKAMQRELKRGDAANGDDYDLDLVALRSEYFGDSLHLVHESGLDKLTKMNDKLALLEKEIQFYTGAIEQNVVYQHQLQVRSKVPTNRELMILSTPKNIEKAKLALREAEARLEAGETIEIGAGDKVIGQGQPAFDMHVTATHMGNGELVWRYGRANLTESGAADFKRYRETIGRSEPNDFEALTNYAEALDAASGNREKRMKWLKRQPIEKEGRLIKQAHRYLKSMRDWQNESPETRGDAPKPSKALEKAGWDLDKMNFEMRKLTANAARAAEDAAQNVVASNSAVQRMLNSSDPATVMEGIKIAGETEGLIPPHSNPNRFLPAVHGTLEQRTQKFMDIIENETPEAAGTALLAAEPPNLTRIVEDLNGQYRMIGDRVNQYADGADGGLFHAPRMWFNKFSFAGSTRDGLGLRQNFLSLMGQIPNRAGLEMAQMSLDAAQKHRVITESATIYWNRRSKEFRKSLDGLEAKFGKGARDKAIQEIRDYAETGVRDLSVLTAAQVQLLQGLDGMYRNYGEALEMMGFKTHKDGPYITRILKDVENIQGKHFTPSQRRRWSEAVSRFTKARTSDYESGLFMDDLGEIISIYTNSVNRMVAYRPVIQTFADTIKTLGINADSVPEGYINRKSKSLKQFAWLEFDMGSKEVFRKGGKINMKTAMWMQRQAERMAGLPGAIERVAEQAVEAAELGIMARLGSEAGRGAAKAAMFTGRNVFRALATTVNALGVGGLPVGGAVRNVVSGGAVSFADPALGPKWFAKGASNLFTQDPHSGNFRLNPVARELGVADTAFVNELTSRQFETLKAKSKAAGTKDGVAWFLDNVWLKMFGASEVLVRGATGVGAYENAMSKLITAKRNGDIKGTHAELHGKAIRAARVVMQRTQVDFSKVNGAAMFGTEVGRVAGQFQRFQWNHFDQQISRIESTGLFGSRRAASARGRLATIDELVGLKEVGAENRISRGIGGIALYMGMILAATGAVQALGFDMPELDGYFSSSPEIVKGVGAFAIENAGQGLVSTGAEGDDGLVKIDDEQSRLLGTRGVQKYFGFQPFGRHMGEWISDSFSPAVSAMWSIGDAISLGHSKDADMDRRVATEYSFFLGGTTAQRFFRMASEIKDGVMWSKASGQRLGPDNFDDNETLTNAEIVARALGFTPTRVAETYERLAYAKTAQRDFEAQYSNLRNEAGRMLDGGNKSGARQVFISGMAVLEEMWSAHFTPDDLKRRFKSLETASKQRTDHTYRERIEDELPFDLKD
jgi:hypothetical protein